MIKYLKTNKLYNTLTYIKNGMIGSFVIGFGSGLFPNKINIKFNGKTYSNVPFPLITCCVSLISFVLSPLLITNYICNNPYFDKLIDKYDFDVKRYHQYDGNNDKYGYPSLLIININYKLQNK